MGNTPTAPREAWTPPSKLSFSQASKAHQCMRAWEMRYIHKRPDPPKDYLVMGSFVHRLMELADAAKRYDLPFLQGVAHAAFMQLTESGDWKALKLDRKAFKTEVWGHFMRGVELRKSGKLGTPRHVELEIDLEIDGVPFRGFIDIVDEEPGGLWIDDWKGLALDTPLPTPTGWTTVAAVEVGDQLIDMNGRPTTVIGKSGIRDRRCFRVTFDDTTEIVADDEHQWVELGLNGEMRQVSTLEMFERTRRLRDEGISTSSREGAALLIRVPVAEPIQLPAQDLPLDPYVLGLWLADGGRGKGSITIGESKLGVLDELRRRGFESHEPGWSERQRSDRGSEAREIAVPGLRGPLRRLGVLWDRHIPEQYMRGSLAQRLDLLRGLMDGDGCFNKRRNQVVFASVNKDLAAQVYELVVSLGWRALNSEVARSGFGLKVTCYEVAWRPWRFSPFLARADKGELPLASAGQQGARRVVKDVVEIDPVPTQCVGVDAPTHTYLATHSMVPTHNTGKKVFELDPRYGSLKRNEEERSKQFQVLLYAHAVRELLGEPVQGGRFIFTALEPAGILVARNVLEDSAKRWLSKAWTMIHEAVAEQHTLANSGPLCGWCPYVHECPEGRRAAAKRIREGKSISDELAVAIKGVDLDDWEFYGLDPE